MKKFIFKLSTYILLMSFICTSAIILHKFIIKNQNEQSYNASIIDKISRLKSINEPKIILVGNSNLAFGIDSPLLEKEMKMPVVNLGLHGGLGNSFHEDMAKFNINKGDIIVVAHSNYAHCADIASLDLAWITIEMHRDLWPIIRKDEYDSMIKAYPNYFFRSLKLWIRNKGNKSTDAPYARNAFNKYGDVVEKPISAQINEKFFEKNRTKVPEIDQICVNRLNQFAEYASEKGASVVIVAYPIEYGEYTKFQKSDFEKFENNLRSKLNCEVISKYTDYFMQYSMFYDNVLHLNKIGAEHRTKLLIKDLKAWQRKQH